MYRYFISWTTDESRRVGDFFIYTHSALQSTGVKTILLLVHSNPTFFGPLVAAFVAIKGRVGLPTASAAITLLWMEGI